MCIRDRYRCGRRVKAGGKPHPATEKIEKCKKLEILMNNIPKFILDENIKFEKSI